MSYQQFPGQPGAPQQPYGAPGGPAPVVQQPAAPFAPAPTPGGRRTGLLIAGVVVLLGGVGGGLALLASAGSSYEDATKNLARAPIGCTTTLEFDAAATYYVYVETTGTIGDVRGSCENTDTDYDTDADADPDVTLTLTNEDGDEIDIDDEDSKDYDAGGFVGHSIGAIEIEDAGKYVLSVDSQDEDFAISVGKDPKEAAGPAGVIGLALAVVGGLVGLILIVLGLRRKQGTPEGGVAAPVAAYQPPPTAAYPVQQQPGYPAPPAPGFGQPAPPAPGFGQPQPPAPGGWQQPQA